MSFKKVLRRLRVSGGTLRFMKSFQGSEVVLEEDFKAYLTVSVDLGGVLRLI